VKSGFFDLSVAIRPTTNEPKLLSLSLARSLCLVPVEAKHFRRALMLLSLSFSVSFLFFNEGGEVGGSSGKLGGEQSPFFISSSCSYDG